jgi:hypothetical protein
LSRLASHSPAKNPRKKKPLERKKKHLKRKRKEKKRVAKKEAKRAKQDLHHNFKKALKQKEALAPPQNLPIHHSKPSHSNKNLKQLLYKQKNPKKRQQAKTHQSHKQKSQQTRQSPQRTLITHHHLKNREQQPHNQSQTWMTAQRQKAEINPNGQPHICIVKKGKTETPCESIRGSER